MYTISKDFHFSAAHRLRGLPDDHQCARDHGHNYVVRVELAREETDDVGFVYDYGDLAFVGRLIDGTFDHRVLNDVLEFNPTAELLARYLYHVVAAGIPEPVVCVGVGVSETPKTWAWFRP